jgi:tetratricopeptide (TPR) repeat protein
MPIEGPLRELGIHDVFQLLDLSRKTGMLRVSSELREDEGVVYFDGGRVVQATIRSKANLPVEIGALTQKELERQLRLQIESVVFDLMSWREGFFSFEERSRDEMPSDTRITVSTESLLMEGARRIDEWSRIADIVPNLSVIPELAPMESDREGATLDLLPHEWQVLTMIDGERDVRAIAAVLSRDEFEVAKIAYGLATTGIIGVRSPVRTTPHADRSGIETRLDAARTLTRAGRTAEALDELRRAVQEDPLTPRVHLDFAFAAARVGDYASARASWTHVIRLASSDAGAAHRAQEALKALNEFQRLLEADADG